MKNIAVKLAIMTIIVGGKIAPLPIRVNGIEVPSTVILSILSVTLLGIAVLARKPS
jgi:hypothetical protein